jgi:hypothetical protein
MLVLDRKVLWDGSVCLDVHTSHITPLLQHFRNHLSKGKKGTQPERKLAEICETGS